MTSPSVTINPSAAAATATNVRGPREPAWLRIASSSTTRAGLSTSNLVKVGNDSNGMVATKQTVATAPPAATSRGVSVRSAAAVATSASGTT